MREDSVPIFQGLIYRRQSPVRGIWNLVGSKPVAPSDRPDKVVADDFRPNLLFNRPDGSASDEVSHQAFQGVPPRLLPRA